MSIKHTINRNLFKVYAQVKYPLPAWKFFNRKDIAAFKEDTPNLNQVQRRILADMNTTGIATSTLDELFPAQNKLTTLQNFANAREATGSINHKKKFLMDYWGEVVELDIANPFLQTALDPVVLDVANSYMGMQNSLLYLTLQKTIPSHGELTNSQNWHRDPQEQKVVKVFIYLNDINESAGPFVYVPHSAPTQNHYYAKLFPQQPPAGSYPGNDDVEAAIPASDITPMIAKAGTIIFCDTNGLHYGGVAKENPRLMSTFGYSAHTYRENKMYNYDTSFLHTLKNHPKQSRRAIRPQWMSKT